MHTDRLVTRVFFDLCFVYQSQHAMGSMHGAYPVVMNAGMNFDSVRIARADGGWRYVGRVHEYLTGPNKGANQNVATFAAQSCQLQAD
jgi:hypothetical protein